MSADNSALIDFYQLVSNEYFKIVEYVVQELQLTDFDESTIISILKTEKALSLPLERPFSLHSGNLTVIPDTDTLVINKHHH